MPIQNFLNRIPTYDRGYAEIPSEYDVLADLGKDYVYHHFSFDVRSLDAVVIIRFTGGWAIRMGPNDGFVWDGLNHNGLLEYKYLGDAPTEGNLIIRSW
jgi:hypothetical protein